MAFISLPTPEDLDRISLVHFTSQSHGSLIVSSHDDRVLLYDCLSQDLLAQFQSPATVLSAANSGYGATFVGSVDGSVRHVDYENMKLQPALSAHESSDSLSGAVNKLRCIDSSTFVASTYGGGLFLFDPRSSQPAQTYQTPSKIFAMDTNGRYVTVGKAHQKVEIYDVRNMKTPAMVRPTGLRYQVTALRNFPSGEGYALSSIDGRVSVEYYDESKEAQERNFAFKCHRHRDTVSAEDVVHPVTELLFHRQYNTMFTAGGDGNVCVWNWEMRKRMKLLAQPSKEPSMPVSHMDLSPNGGILAIGLSDDSYLRSSDYQAVRAGAGKVYVRELVDADCKPKT